MIKIKARDWKNEIWMKISEIENCNNWYPVIDDVYVSNMGRIKKIKNSNTKYLKGNKEMDGYVRVGINCVKDSNIKYIKIPIHRLVAHSFIFKSNNEYNVVNHINNVRHHNHMWNLEWTTQKGNIRHCVKQGRKNTLRGEDTCISILTNGIVINIIQMIITGLKNKQISDRIFSIYSLKIHPNTICDIRKRRTWTHISTKYDF